MISKAYCFGKVSQNINNLDLIKNGALEKGLRPF